MTGLKLLMSGAVTEMLAASDPPLWRYVATTAVALLAAGAGVVAIVSLVLRRRVQVQFHVGIEATPFYSFRGQGQTYRLRPTGALQELSSSSPAPRVIAPVIRLDVTNRADGPVSVNEVNWSIAVSPREDVPNYRPLAELVVKYVGGSDGREAAEAAYGLNLLSEEGEYMTYACSADDADNLAAQLQADHRVALAFVNAEGVANTEWTHAETVDILLRDSGRHTTPVGKVIDPGGSLSLSYRLGATTDLNAAIGVELLLNSKTVRRLGTLDLELVVPDFVRMSAARPKKRP